MFELGKSNHYKVLNAIPNDFLNEKLTTKDYGIYYSVRFDGDAETYLWQAKTPPVEGETYFGHMEMAKSGKSVRFKKDKEEGVSTEPQSSDTGNAITASMTVKLAFQAFIQAESMLPQEEKHWAQIEYMADMLYKTIGRVKTGVEPKDLLAPITEEDLPDFGDEEQH